MDALAVLLEAPERLSLQKLALHPPKDRDLVIRTRWSGISTGTEKLLWTGRMPAFPGMGYPLVPGYESVGEVIDAGPGARERIGETVFVPGANCYEGARGLFGGSASRLVVPAARVTRVQESLGADAVLLALAATAHHALAGGPPPGLIVGHGVLGRLIARITIALGHPAPVVWEVDAARATGARGYAVTNAELDGSKDYAVVVDASGAPGILDSLVSRIARGGEIVLAGFYDRLDFAFPPAFMKEARFRIAAEFAPADVAAVSALLESGKLALDGLVTHIRPATDAADAYPAAFTDRECLKMVLAWEAPQ